MIPIEIGGILPMLQLDGNERVEQNFVVYCLARKFGVHEAEAQIISPFDSSSASAIWSK